METIKIGLIDDELPSLTRLQKYIAGMPGFNVVFSETNPKQGLHLAVRNTCDILITDIQMGSVNGLVICEQMEQIGLPVIVCSVHEEFAIPSISYSVSAYLLKPVRFDILKETLDKVARKMGERNLSDESLTRDYIIVEDFESFGFAVVKYKDLIYVEQRNNYSFFYTKTNEYKQRSTLYSVENDVKSSAFVRIHKSIIVNIDKVQKIYPKEVLLEDGKLLPMGRIYKDKLMNAYRLVLAQ
jgi:two-component system LytT family response regulator